MYLDTMYQVKNNTMNHVNNNAYDMIMCTIEVVSVKMLTS